MSESAWKAEHGKAVALMDEAKEISRAGFPDGMESQDRFKAKMAEADDFLKRAKMIKEADEKRAELDAIDTASGAPVGGTGIAGIGIATGGDGPHGNGAPIMAHGQAAITEEFVRERKQSKLLIAPSLYRAMGGRVFGAEDKLAKHEAALGQGTNSTGGFLVVPQYAQDLFAAVRRQGNTLARHGWVNRHPTDKTDVVFIPKGAGTLSVGVVPELTAKPVSDNSYGQIQINIYTLAGIVELSKQLAMNADPAVVDILIEDLGALMGNLEEQLWLNGTGTNQPRGVLNTSNTAPLPTATQNLLATGGGTGAAGALRGQDLIDATIDAIAEVKSLYFAAATGILMRPLRLAFIQKAKDANGNYLINAPGNYRAPTTTTHGVDSATEDSEQAPWDFLGTPVATSQNVPNNLGGGVNQDPIIVAAWRELHVFDSMPPTMDSSDVAGDTFYTNKVAIRLEELQGSTAERYPAAFCIATGTAMIGA